MLSRHVLQSLRCLGDALVDCVLPRFCCLCGPGAPADGLTNLCASCFDALTWVEASRQCRACGVQLRPLEVPRGRCLACFGCRRPWSRLVTLGPPEGTLGQLVRKLKYERDLSCAAPLGELLAAQAGLVPGWSGRIDAVIPMPLSRQRWRERGFNQAAVLARPVARELRCPLRAGWLHRRGVEGSQVGQGARSRRSRLARRHFEPAAEVFGRNLLLVDDVVTTQATLKASAGALRRAGARKVDVLVCGRTPMRL